MDTVTQRRTLVARDSAALSLGWIVGIAVCGGVSLFICVGFLMLWKIRRGPPIARRIETEVRVENKIAHDVSCATTIHVSPTRLAKRKMLTAQSDSKLPTYPSSHLSRSHSSRISLNEPAIPAIPPLPSTGFKLFNIRRSKTHRSQAEDEDEEPSKRLSKNLSMSAWVMRDSWFGGAPGVVRDIEAVDNGAVDARFYSDPNLATNVVIQPPHAAYIQEQIDAQQQAAFKQYWHQQAAEIQQEFNKRRGSQSSQPRPLSVAESGLRDILRCTDQRLREGQTSPSRTPRSSLMRPCSLKTPRSLKTNSNSSQHPPSPVKRGSLIESNTWATQVDSTNSIGSAANSLIAEAIEELQLPGGHSSPSRLRGREWETQDNQHLAPNLAPKSPERAPRSPQRNAQRSPQRRRSQDSDASSSLSTLYSEPEEEESHGRAQVMDDPFVEKNSLAARYQPMTGNRPLTSNSDTMIKTTIRVVPSYHRPHSDRTDGRPVRDSALIDPKNLGVVLQPPQMNQSEEVPPKAGEFVQIFEDPSCDTFPNSPESSYDEEEEESFVSVSVASQVSTPKSMSPEDDDIPSKDVITHTSNRRRSPTVSPLSTNGDANDDDAASNASSSPYNEGDIISMLMATSSPKRNLPTPPTVTGPDGTVLTLLSPPPRETMERKVSDSSSYYQSEAPSSVQGSGAVSTGSPAIKPTIKAIQGLNSVSCMVAELRRMDSLRSSQSTGSLQSTQISESSTQLANGLRMGDRHYYNMGKTHTKSYSTGGQPTARPQGARRYPGPPGASKLREQVFDEKENQGLGIRTTPVRSDTAGSQGLREDMSAPNLVIESPRSSPKPSVPIRSPSRPQSSPKGPKPMHQTVEELSKKERRRQKRDSVIIFDGTTFNLADTRNRPLRM